MNKSETIGELTKALIIFHSKVDNLKKDAQNPFFKSSYCTLDNIINTIEAPLNAAKLTFAQFPSGEHGLTSILMHESGEWIESEYFMRPVKDDPQGSGSVITYQRRYALAAILGLSVDTDDDANTATHGGKTPETVEDIRPWLSETQFKQLLERVSKGEWDAYVKADKAFRMKKEYRAAIKKLLNQPA